MIMWGLCMTFMGFVSNWSGLMVARLSIVNPILMHSKWFLGLAEAGLYPGINYYLSCWYKRSELGIRAAVFFSAAAISGSFGGLLAAAIAKMDGLGKLTGWAWLFILEGSLTVILGIASFWLVHDFPEKATFLTPEDRARVIHRLKDENRGSANHEKFEMRYFLMALKDYKMWLGMAIFAGAGMPLYAFSIFLPSIVRELGYTLTSAQLLSVPPYIFAAILTILIGWIADRKRQRGIFNILTSTLGIIGFTMLLVSQRPGVKYAGTFLGALGIYPCLPNTITWISNNIEGVYKRGIVLGFVIGWGNLNGIVSSNIYYRAPKYTVGHAVVIAYMTFFLLGGSILMRFLLNRENNLRKSGERNHQLSDLDSTKDVGDIRPNFIYTL
ncbi:putative transporter [Erysiphe neolycopersici]|uniref:Putative transporter n=1 Tax=Erysiphe neolycopersici TaxID=212602 RepID=A0A420HFI8_9PEZI|nr:putative transporter [Erysiphe neolycopersici]